MAYRFLLEVPETLADDASAVVSTVSDAQILVVRNSHGLGFDDPYVDLTIAAHSLQVIDQLYRWIDELGLTRPESRVVVGLVLHGGRRLALHEMTPPRVVSAIRRDQPWVEHTLPKIGEHERDIVREDVRSLETATGTAPGAAAIAIVPSRATTSHSVLDVDMIDAEDTLTVGGTEYALIPVLEMAAAEQFYSEIFGLQLVQRIRRDAAGGWEELGRSYAHDRAARDNTEADIVFLMNGALGLALQRVGRAARLDYARIASTVGITVDPRSAARIKAMVLMRGYTLLGSAGDVFEFRDPFGIAWNVQPGT